MWRSISTARSGIGNRLYTTRRWRQMIGIWRNSLITFHTSKESLHCCSALSGSRQDPLTVSQSVRQTNRCGRIHVRKTKTPQEQNMLIKLKELDSANKSLGPLGINSCMTQTLTCRRIIYHQRGTSMRLISWKARPVKRRWFFRILKRWQWKESWWSEPNPWPSKPAESGFAVQKIDQDQDQMKAVPARDRGERLKLWHSDAAECSSDSGKCSIWPIGRRFERK